MEITSVRNQYRGINPHLNSQRQQVGGGWKGFHNGHITHLAMAMRAGLRMMGYTAEIEDSLQIWHGTDRERRPESDVMIYDQDLQRSSIPSGIFAPAAGAAVLSMSAATDRAAIDVKPYWALAIYGLEGKGRRRGEPVAWVEFLSPSNKPGGRDFDAYWNKRESVLESGLVFVEIDYLHQSPPTIGGVGNYRACTPGAHPYRIVVADPRPNLRQGRIYVHEFDVDTLLPTVNIPLNAGDVLAFDFDAPYQKMFAETFYGDEVDYSQLPVRFETYCEADQLRILARMLAIVKAAERGANLEQAKIEPLESVSMEEALERLAAAQQ